MAALRDMGVWVGVAGNQPSRAGTVLRSLDLPADLIAMSDDWGVQKPDPGVFRAITDAAPCPAERIIYVGDRLDNDLRQARAARDAHGVHPARPLGLHLAEPPGPGDGR